MERRTWWISIPLPPMNVAADDPEEPQLRQPNVAIADRSATIVCPRQGFLAIALDCLCFYARTLNMARVHRVRDTCIEALKRIRVSYGSRKLYISSDSLNCCAILCYHPSSCCFDTGYLGPWASGWLTNQEAQLTCGW